MQQRNQFILITTASLFMLYTHAMYDPKYAAFPSSKQCMHSNPETLGSNATPTKPKIPLKRQRLSIVTLNLLPKASPSAEKAKHDPHSAGSNRSTPELTPTLTPLTAILTTGKNPQTPDALS